MDCGDVSPLSPGATRRARPKAASCGRTPKGSRLTLPTRRFGVIFPWVPSEADGLAASTKAQFFSGLFT